MSVRRARLLVWIALLVAMPVPLVIVGQGRVPVGPSCRSPSPIWYAPAPVEASAMTR